MQDGNWNRLKDVLGRVLELPAAERTAFVERECGDDDALRRDVEELLSAHEQAAGRLGDDDADEGPGSSIGPYKLQQLIGEGGFGAVYMAEQKEPIRRRVALKIIKLGMDTREVIARFEAERQALAMMDHPGIAKVLDAGTTKTGRPYFVMELVGGVPITEFCDHNRLDTDHRLELFLQVCRAVQHAHQKGIIHRDLKPNNVLVAVRDGAPVAKVIDFGIAKATGGGLTDKTVFTEFRQFLGTPQYMSPEQATLGGLDVDTRSDIYSLGVLLYELLTGEPPLDARRLRDAALEEMKRIISDEEPPKPSTRVSTAGPSLATLAKNRMQEPAQLVRSLRGDLDWIVLKALEKDRGRRYPTANDLAGDIERHRADEPVIASPPSLVYRASKFVRRNRGAVLAGAGLVLTLLAGLVVSVLALVEARAGRALAADEARRRGAVADFLGQMLATAGSSERGVGTELSVVNLLDQARAQLADSEIVRDPLSYSRIAMDLVDAYREQLQGRRGLPLVTGTLAALADVEPDPIIFSRAASALISHHEDFDGAWSQPERVRSVYGRAMELLRPGIEARQPAALRQLWAWTQALPSWDLAEGERAGRRLLAIVEDMTEPAVDPVFARRSLAHILYRRGREDASHRQFAAASDRLRELLDRDEIDTLIEVVTSRRGPGVRFREAFDLELLCRIAVRIRDAGKHDVRTAHALLRLGGELPWPTTGDDLLFNGDPVAPPQYAGLAETLFRAALEILRERVPEDHPLVVWGLSGLASTIPFDRFDEKVARFREAMRYGTGDVEHDIELRGDFAIGILMKIREIGETAGAAPELLAEGEALAEWCFEKAAALRLADEDKWSLLSRWGAAELLTDIYRALQAREPSPEHRTAHQRWRDRYRELVPEVDRRAEREGPASGLHLLVAQALLRLEPIEDRDPERAREIARRCVAGVGRDIPAAHATLALAQAQCGDLAAAVEAQRQAVALFPEGHPRLAPHQARLAEYQAALRDRKE